MWVIILVDLPPDNRMTCSRWLSVTTRAPSQTGLPATRSVRTATELAD